ncbi:MAG: ferrochelatase, partial [Alphaproteobacteria bacterium]|nr:ferrochelatase [Alphaproteobacteria bacterium]
MKKKTALTPKLQKCPLHFIHNTPLEIPQELSPPHMEEKIGVVVVNLGTPDNISIKSIRSYLKEFLSDRRVIGTCPFLWKLLLNTIILTFRPRKTAEVYRKVWFEKTNESPLLYYT